MSRVFLFGGDLLKKYSIHLVATNRLSNVKDMLEGLKEFEGQEVELSISKWNYSFLALNYSLTNEIVEEPDIMLIFDNAEYSRIDGATGKNIGYKKMIDALRTAKINLQKSRIVLVLSEDKKEDKTLISEIMKIDLQNIFFSGSEDLDVNSLKAWIFGPERTLEDNKEYLAQDEVLNFQPAIKYIDRIVEKPVIQTEVVEKIIEKTSVKVIEKIVEVEGEKAESFKKLILTVWDNAEFGCELAYMAAKLSGLEVLLVDADLLSPKVDLILNVKRNSENIKTEGMRYDSGFNIIMDTIEKNVFTPTFFSEACVNRKELKNLHILTGNYNLEKYEYYSKDSYKIFLEKCYHAFDITIILVNRSMYDLFTLISLDKSDYNLIATKSDLISIRDFNSHIQFLHEKQQIDINKFKYIGFEYTEGICLRENILKEITEGNFLGNISYAKKRVMYRNLKAPYVRRIPIQQIDEYKDILTYFKIANKRKLMDKLRSRNKIIKLKFRSFFKKFKHKRK